MNNLELTQSKLTDLLTKLGLAKSSLPVTPESEESYLQRPKTEQVLDCDRLIESLSNGAKLDLMALVQMGRSDGYPTFAECREKAQLEHDVQHWLTSRAPSDLLRGLSAALIKGGAR